MEKWESLDTLGFPGYKISSEGEVRNARTDNPLRLSPNQYGVVRVGLMSQEEGRQKTLSLPRLVANMFVPGKSAQFNTPINLNGDRNDNSAKNLVWRPRWFAVKFFHQFEESQIPLWETKFFDVETSEEYENSREAACKHGLLEEDVMKAIVNGTPCFPTWQRFARVTQ